MNACACARSHFATFAFGQTPQQNLDLVQRGNKAEFIARFRKIAEWFGPFSEQAMRESTFLVDKLVHRF